jgi:ribosomal protein S15P/S13E
MSEKQDGRAENFSGVKTVSQIAIEMRAAIIELAGPRDWHATRESWLRGAAAKAGIGARQAKALFYAESPDPKSSTVERVRAAVLAKRREDHQQSVENRREMEKMVSRIEALEAALHRIDPEFYRETTTALREAIHPRGGSGRAVDRE